MAVATKSCVPAIITAGDTVIFSVGPDSLHPNTGWTMTFVLSRLGRTLKTWAAASAASAGFVVTLPGADFSNIPAGAATWTYLFTETATSQRETGSIGETLIAQDPTKSLPDSEAAKALKACWATINIIVADPNASADFNGQTYTSLNLDTLFKIRDRLQVIVDGELRALGLTRRGGAKLILARFR